MVSDPTFEPGTSRLYRMNHFHIRRREYLKCHWKFLIIPHVCSKLGNSEIVSHFQQQSFLTVKAMSIGSRVTSHKAQPRQCPQESCWEHVFYFLTHAGSTAMLTPSLIHCTATMQRWLSEWLGIVRSWKSGYSFCIPGNTSLITTKNKRV